MLNFLHFGIIDLIDITIVAYLFYQFYLLIRQSVAERIFYIIVGVYFLWILVKALHFELLSTILGHIMGVGIIAVLIVFQQEVRRFLLFVATKSTENLKMTSIFSQIFHRNYTRECQIPINEIIIACQYLKDHKIGGLIILSDKDSFENFYESGHIINAEVKSTLIETIFFKNTPLHDGAMFIVKDKITAVGCVLPLTERTDLPYYLGLRHRAALGISEITDALVIIISEERGQLSYAEFGKIVINTDLNSLKQKIERKFFKNTLKK